MLKQALGVIAVSGLGMFLSGSPLAQPSNAVPGIPGYYNPTTHTFQTRVTPRALPDASTLKDYTGTLKFEYTIKVDTPVPSGEEMLCEASTLLEDDASDGLEYQESASSVAKVSGSSASCTVQIPYAWPLEETSGTVSISYSVVIAPSSATSQINEYATRAHSSATYIALPSVGATTVVPLSVTL